MLGRDLTGQSRQDVSGIAQVCGGQLQRQLACQGLHGLTQTLHRDLQTGRVALSGSAAPPSLPGIVRRCPG